MLARKMATLMRPRPSDRLISSRSAQMVSTRNKSHQGAAAGTASVLSQTRLPTPQQAAAPASKAVKIWRSPPSEISDAAVITAAAQAKAAPA